MARLHGLRCDSARSADPAPCCGGVAAGGRAVAPHAADADAPQAAQLRRSLGAAPAAAGRLPAACGQIARTSLKPQAGPRPAAGGAAVAAASAPAGAGAVAAPCKAHSAPGVCDFGGGIPAVRPPSFLAAAGACGEVGGLPCALPLAASKQQGGEGAAAVAAIKAACKAAAVAAAAAGGDAKEEVPPALAASGAARAAPCEAGPRPEPAPAPASSAEGADAEAAAAAAAALLSPHARRVHWRQRRRRYHSGCVVPLPPGLTVEAWDELR
jgi:hypothetical protein